VDHRVGTARAAHTKLERRQERQADGLEALDEAFTKEADKRLPNNDGAYTTVGF
jgi:hypothetical protein